MSVMFFKYGDTLKRLALATLLIGLALGPARSLSASAFRVNPIRITFDRSTKSVLLTLSNDSTDELRFQVSAVQWAQEQGTGEMQLTPTDDILFFPALLTLKAGEERKVRIGSTVKSGATEKTYRIFFEELPALQTPRIEKGSQVRIITKMGIPIFVEPEKKVAAGSITNFAVRGGKAWFDVRNTGNVHFLAQSVRVVGLDAAGQPLFDKQREGWYVLSGGTRTYDLPLSAAECSKLKTVRVEVQTDVVRPEVSVLKNQYAVPEGICSK